MRIKNEYGEKIYWRAFKGEAPYPASRDRKDLRNDRAALLAASGGAGCG